MLANTLIQVAAISSKVATVKGKTAAMVRTTRMVEAVGDIEKAALYSTTPRIW